MSDYRTTPCRCGTEAFLRYHPSLTLYTTRYTTRPASWRVKCESPICQACTGACASEAEAMCRWEQMLAVREAEPAAGEGR